MTTIPADSPTRLIFSVLLVFVALNLFMPGESSALSLILAQAVIFGFAALYLAFFKPTVRPTLWMLPAVCWAAAFVVSQAASLHAYDSLRLAVQFTSLILLAWLASETAPGEKQLVISLSVLVGVGALLSIVGLLQVVTFFAHPPSFDLVSKVLPVSQNYLQQVYTQKRIFSTFVLPTSFSAFLAMVLPLGAGLMVHLRRKRIPLMLLAAANVLMLLALVQAQSHGGPVSLALAAGAATLIYLRQKKLPVVRIIVALVVAAALVIFAIGFIRGTYLWDLTAVNSPIRLRWELWMAGFSAIGQHWMTGIGAGNFPLVLYPHLSAEVRPTKFLHNSYLQLPLELGMLGAIALLLALVLLLRRYLRGNRDEREIPNALHYAVMTGALVFLFANFLEIVVYFQSLGLIGAFLIGLSLRRERTASLAHLEKQSFRAWRYGGAALCGLALLFLCRWFLADHFYDRAADMVTQDVIARAEVAEAPATPEADETGQAQKNEDSLKEVAKFIQIATTIDPGNYRYHLLMARAEEQFAPEDTGAALAEVSAALACNPALPSLHYSRGMLLLRHAEPLGAASELAEAVRLYPGNEEYLRALQATEMRLNTLINRRMGNPR